MAEALLLITVYHAVLFRHFYFQNADTYARGEFLEQGFSSSRLLGEHLRRYGFFSLRPVHDPYYYGADYSALPFTQTYYWPHRLQAWVGSWLTLGHAFRLYSLTTVLHCWLASVSVYTLASAMGHAPLSAGFASVTLSSLAYALKPNASIVSTLAWVPVYLLSCSLTSTMLTGISVGMMLTAGYWPLALPLLPLGCWLWLSA